MKTIRGDLLSLALAGQFDVIVHGCNCMCQMGKGIAKSIKLQFPEAYSADRRTTRGDQAKLGTITTADIERDGRGFVVINAYTQYDYRPPGPNVDYDAIRSAMRQIKERFAGKRIAYPKIGAGLAGGDWNKIAIIIEDELVSEDHTLVEYAPGTPAECRKG